MSEDMRGLFFVMKGQYKRGAEPSFINKVSQDTMHIGGFDPYSEDTVEWYMVYDNRKFHCIRCGSDLNKVLRGVYNTIKKYKGNASRYFKSVDENRQIYKESLIMRHLHEKVYEEYGDFFKDSIQEMEDLAYEELKGEKPINKARKLMKTKLTGRLEKTEAPKKEEVKTPSAPKKVKPKVKLGVKKIPLE